MTTENAIDSASHDDPIGRYRAWLHEWRTRRRQRIGIARLDDLPDRLLRDIGQTRPGIATTERVTRAMISAAAPNRAW